LEDGLLFGDIWSKDTRFIPFQGIYENPKYSALFDKITRNIEQALDDLGLPNFGQI